MSPQKRNNDCNTYMPNTAYRMSFTTGGLGHAESLLLTTLYLQLGDWYMVREQANSDNVLQLKKASSSRRIVRELIARLKTLSQSELEFLAEADTVDQRNLIWLSICRCYSFIADFALEVLREHYLSLKSTLTLEEFDAFFNRKAEWHDELDRMAPSSRKKIRQVLFRMLREAQLLTADKSIIAPNPSPALYHTITNGPCLDVLDFSGQHVPKRVRA